MENLHDIEDEYSIPAEILSFSLQVKFEFAIHALGSTNGFLQFETRVCLVR